MIFVQHHQTAPRKLADKYMKGTPSNAAHAWNSFKGKKELTSNLTVIQNGLCAYCEIRLDDEIGSHLEHIESKSLNPEKTFEYTNIVCSCIKDSLDDSEDSDPISCGHAKDKLSIKIKPINSGCQDYFSYDLFGKIIPSEELNEVDNEEAQSTIDILNLNCKRLKRQRESILEEGFTIISELSSNLEALNHFLDLELNCINNKYFSFINLRREHFGSYRC